MTSFARTTPPLSPPLPSPSSSSSTSLPSPPRRTLYSALHSRRFPLACLLCLSSITISIYRISAYHSTLDQQHSTRDELIKALERLTVQVERRKNRTQQQMHSVWAVPLTASFTSSPAPPSLASPSSSWFSWKGWMGWWRGGVVEVKESEEERVRSELSSITLPLCASHVNTSSLLTLSSPSPSPSPAFIRLVVEGCDHVLHTGQSPPHPLTTSSISPTLTSSPAPSATEPSPSQATPPPPSQSVAGAGVVTGTVTGSGKRLMV